MPDPDLAPFTGAVAAGFEPLLERLRDLPRLLAAPAPPRSPFARSRVVRIEVAGTALAVKAFPAQGPIRSRLARRYGSKARRSWDVAAALHQNGIGTPRPVAWLERWDRGRLAESYFVTEYAEAASTLHEELLNLFHDEFQFGKFLNLLDPVAAATRAMHDAGVYHGDLGNQNVFLRRLDPWTWGEVSFFDLNRGRAGAPLTMRERGRDLSRLTLPGRLRDAFFRMYFRERFFRNERPPRDFLRWERFARLRFAVHSATRPLRHPVKWLRRRAQKGVRGRYPGPRERWVWDERSDQPIGIDTKAERLRGRSPLASLKLAAAAAWTWPAVRRKYRRLLGECWRAPVAMKDRVAMTLHPAPETADRERELLAGLGPVPVLLRFYAHDAPADWDFTAGQARELRDAGHAVAIALVQDRRAVREPSRWAAFADHVLGAAGEVAEWCEVGHAVNRTKWGIWTRKEYGALWAPLARVRERHPRLKLMGPAVNDFEFHYVPASTAAMPRDARLDALSLHLYVDRRGAPESRQGAYSSLEKFALARAYAARCGRGAGGVVVSEVNWFLRDPGGYAHPFAPYASPDDPGWAVTEDDYADYMLRYLLLATCSGMVDRVYWWRLVAAPFGLVDDSGAAWSTRPAFDALRLFLREFGDATFLERLPSPDDAYLLRFRRPAGDAVIAWATGPRRMEIDFAWTRACTATGGDVKRGGPLDLGGRPVYLFA